jgi:hypothetical protein
VRRKASGIGLLVVVVMFLLVLGPIPVHAASSIVQQNNGGCVDCASATLAVAFSSDVASGNVVVVGIEAFGGGGPAPATSVTSLVDSLSSSYTQAVTSTDGNDYVYIYYATLSSSGSDTVTATFGGSGTDTAQNVYIYEVSGVVPTGAAVDNNAGAGTSSVSATNYVSFPPGAFLLGMIGTENGYSSPSVGMTVSPGAGFTLSSDNSGSGFSHAQYATSGVSSPTNFPATITNPSPNYYWAEASVALDPIPVTTVSSAGPVGGFLEPVNKLAVFAPYLALFVLAAVVAVGVAKPWKKPEN